MRSLRRLHHVVLGKDHAHMWGRHALFEVFVNDIYRFVNDIYRFVNEIYRFVNEIYWDVKDISVFQ